MTSLASWFIPLIWSPPSECGIAGKLACLPGIFMDARNQNSSPLAFMLVISAISSVLFPFLYKIISF